MFRGLRLGYKNTERSLCQEKPWVRNLGAECSVTLMAVHRNSLGILMSWDMSVKP